MRLTSNMCMAVMVALLLTGCAGSGGDRRGPNPPPPNNPPPIPKLPRRQLVDINSITIPTVRNQTTQYGIEDYLTNRIIQQFIGDGRLNVLAEDGQLILRSHIYRYVREPIVYNDQDEVLKYSVGLWLECALYENGSDTPLWRDRDLYAKTTYSDLVTPIENENEVQQRLADDLAILVANRVLEGWARIK